jgi:isopentenyl diphosphate isomerase/L-lactate dehydrogenase-like FMN-dependent dehydrogenase
MRATETIAHHESTRPEPNATVSISDRPVSLFEYETRAEEILPTAVWDFIAGGVLDEITLRRNRAAFEELALNLRPLRDVSRRALATTVLGERISLPVFLSPAGAHRLAHDEGELETARGAALSDTLMVAAVRADKSLEAIAAVTDAPLWFQLKYFGKRITADLIRLKRSGRI